VDVGIPDDSQLAMPDCSTEHIRPRDALTKITISPPRTQDVFYSATKLKAMAA
jgi:hypothetical protein